MNKKPDVQARTDVDNKCKHIIVIIPSSLGGAAFLFCCVLVFVLDVCSCVKRVRFFDLFKRLSDVSLARPCSAKFCL